MDRQYPIYTAEAECQDCYKCVRHCPVKAIRLKDGHAMVLPERCIACGTCVAVCPAQAKHIRDDRGRAKHLLSAGRPVYVSLAPSWASEFAGITPAQMVASLQALGFRGASETALGAQEVSAATAERLEDGGLFLSSACPAAVSYIEKYMPEHVEAITGLFSPLLAHCRLLREHFGQDIGIVFIGPCVAKKGEADSHPELLDIALTFEDLRTWFDESGINPWKITPSPQHRFVPETAEEGALYPVEGGMIETLKPYANGRRAKYVALAGIDALRDGLKDFTLADTGLPVFVECLACDGGCVNGPCSVNRTPMLSRRMSIETRVVLPEQGLNRKARPDLVEAYGAEPVMAVTHTEAEIVEALARVGKAGAEDEINCGGCGYNSCRAFAQAMLDGRGEPQMCVSFMRKQAQKKANALLRCMPSGVVIVNAAGRIVECNERFAQMFGEDTMQVFDTVPGLANCLLKKVISFSHLFDIVLQSNEDLHHEHLRVGNRLFNITIFTLEPHQVVGGVILDVTRQEFQRDQIAKRANEVIKRNLSTVQEVACRLGEHMAETEILLRSIAEGYEVDEPPAPSMVEREGLGDD